MRRSSARCRRSPRRIPRPTRKMGLKDLCDGIHKVYREDNLPKAQRDMYTTLPEMAMRPADAYEQSRARAGRERRDRRPDGPHPGRDGGALSAGHSADHAGRAHHRRRPSRSRTICSTRASSTASSRASRPTSTACASSRPTGGRRYLVDCVAKASCAMIPRDVKAPTIADPVPQAAQGRRDRRPTRPADQGAARPDRRRELRDRGQPTASTATSPKMPRSAPISRWSTASASRRARKLARAVRAHRLPHAALGAGRFAPASPTWRCSA